MDSRLYAVACSMLCSALLFTASASIAQGPSVAGSGTRDPATAEAERQVAQPLNNAPVWRGVRSGEPAITAVRGREAAVLIQPTMKLPFEPAVTAGEAWRLARPPLSTLGGTLVALTLLALFGFYRWRGSIGVHEPP
ncbi:MAG: formate dehydrogenase subunit gamma, partial [Betaproteobacteria bacterium]|nr:formate dehydrogenase subunit gamma [Betaproteobacteria bacterium]